MKITEYRAYEILCWLDDQAGDHTNLFEQMTFYRDAAALIRQLRDAEQSAWHAGLDAGREQGRGKDHAHQPAAPSAPEAQSSEEVEYEFEVWQNDLLQAGGSTFDYATAKSEADHYALMYEQGGPIEVRIYMKRRITTAPRAPVGVDANELAGVRARLKSGDYDGTDIMRAWLAIDTLLALTQQDADHHAITHCDNCGCDWPDNGLNSFDCPYCKRPAAVDEVHEMFLCESSRLHLYPDRLYRFTVDPKCSLCAEAALAAQTEDSDNDR